MKLQFNRTIGEIFYIHPVTEEEVGVMTIEPEINYDAIESMLEGYNAGYSLSRVKSNMEQDDRLTGDEIDYIVEQLEMFEEDMEKKSVEEVSPWTQEHDKTWSELTPAQITETIEILQQGKEVGEQIADTVITAMKKERKKREPKTSNGGVQGTSKKTLTPQEYMESLLEKVELCKILSDVQYPEVPADLSKTNRNLMLEMNKELEGVVTTYLQKIQEL